MPRISLAAAALAALACYAVLLAAGWIAVAGRGPAPWSQRQRTDWVAARDLRAMAQVDSADLAAPDDTAGKRLPPRAALVGRHLVTNKARGAPIARGDVGPLVLGTPGTGRVRFVVTARGSDVPVLSLSRPGDVLTPCVAAGTPPAWACSGAAFTVLALHRPATARDSLWAVLEAGSAEQAAEFAGAPARTLVRR